MGVYIIHRPFQWECALYIDRLSYLGVGECVCLPVDVRAGSVDWPLHEGNARNVKGSVHQVIRIRRPVVSRTRFKHILCKRHEKYLFNFSLFSPNLGPTCIVYRPDNKHLQSFILAEFLSVSNSEQVLSRPSLRPDQALSRPQQALMRHSVGK